MWSSHGPGVVLAGGEEGVDTTESELGGKVLDVPDAVDAKESDVDQPRSFGYLPDIARGLATLGERDAADGRAWIFPAAPPLTARALVELIGRDLGRQVKLVVTSKPAMRLAGLFTPQARQLPDIWYQFSAPFTVDGSSFETAFGGFGPTAHERAVHETVHGFAPTQRESDHLARLECPRPRRPLTVMREACSVSSLHASGRSYGVHRH